MNIQITQTKTVKRVSAWNLHDDAALEYRETLDTMTPPIEDQTPSWEITIPEEEWSVEIVAKKSELLHELFKRCRVAIEDGELSKMPERVAEYGEPEWVEMDDNEMSSTVAYFEGGYRKGVYKKIAIWRGTVDINEKTGEKEVVLSTTTDPPEWANYVIEVLVDDDLEKQKFAETKTGAETKAERLTEKL